MLGTDRSPARGVSHPERSARGQCFYVGSLGVLAVDGSMSMHEVVRERFVAGEQAYVGDATVCAGLPLRHVSRGPHDLPWKSL